MQKQEWQEWEEKFDDMTPRYVPSNSDSLYGEKAVSEWLKTNTDKHLYEDSVYNEPMLDLSAEKIKNFISTLLEEQEKRLKEKYKNYF